MYNDDVQWLSQNIFTHRDNEYGSGGYMRVSMSTNTKDSMSFSAPMFVITISNDGLSKSASLSYQKLFELYGRLQEVVKVAGNEYSNKLKASPDAQLHYKVGKSNFLTFEFLRGSQQNEPVVRMTISHGTSDSTKVLMPFLPEFYAFINLIGDMIKDKKYIDWCLHFPNRYFLTGMNEIAKQIPGLVKSAVVQIDREAPSTPNAPSEPEPQKVDEENVQSASETMKDLNAFMGEDMENIDLDMPKIAGEPKTSPPKEESRLFKWLGGDLKNYENILMRCCEKPNPIRELEKELNENYGDMDCFPNISAKDMKSIVYLVGREYFLYNEQANNGSIKRSFTINKYRGETHAKPINRETAFDLLFLHIIIKILREKIENKTSDNYTNKTLLHLASSMNVSPFIFSFLSKGTELSTIIMKKFLEAKELGMFKSYEEDEFKNYGFEITDKDIRDVTSNLGGYFESDAYRSDSPMRHVALHSNKSCLLSPDNGLNEEQIINQVVPFEMYILMKNKNPDTDKKDLLAYAKDRGFDSAVVSLFVKTTPRKMIPIVKFFEDHSDEVPEDKRVEFMEWIGEFGEKDYDLSDSRFPYDSFGEDAIKALYLWKPESEEKFTTYKKFQKAVINSVHDKNTILSMISHAVEEEKGETFADFYVNANGKG